MRFVPIKTTEQLDLRAIHRVRSGLVSRRTGIINQIRAFLPDRVPRRGKVIGHPMSNPGTNTDAGFVVAQRVGNARDRCPTVLRICIHAQRRQDGGACDTAEQSAMGRVCGSYPEYVCVSA